ncbi:MAG: (Fe-S)-binding protein, partial [Actinoallomurus sp.]
MSEHGSGEIADQGAGRVFGEETLGRCISCGFCLPACPTYALTGDEASSPRGRITLMRALQTGALEPDDRALAEQSSFCLGCRACEPVCPAGVEYGTLLEQWRDHQWRGRRRPLLARILTTLVSRPGPLRLQGLVRRYARTRPGGEGPSLLLGCVERGLYPRVSRAVRRLRPEIAAPARQGCCGALHAHAGRPADGIARARRLERSLDGFD